MVLVTAFSQCATNDRDTIRSAAANLVAATRREDGCEDYTFYEDTGAAGRFVFVERWRDRAALDAHLKAPHIDTWRDATAGKTSNRSVVIYEVASMEPL